PEWLPLLGNLNWLLFSYNKRMLHVPEEHSLIIKHKLGIVFLTNGVEHIDRVLLLLLKKWDTLDLLWNTTDRPFVRFLSPDGRRLTDNFRGFHL
ncbi:MAG: hypothetical protein Q7T04_04255, partial [Dehalococcoidia bacterium]|nr:hypothetical protein [Dehalococcoidia bacterium]